MASQVKDNLNRSFRDRLKEKKIVITHTDLDGVGCFTLLMKVFPNVEVVTVRSPSDLPKVIKEVFSRFEIDNKSTHLDVFITDLGLNDSEIEAVAILDDYFKNSSRSVLYVDHHKTSDWLKLKDWAVVDTSFAATKVLWKVLSEVFSLDDLQEFVEMVHNYDTWNLDPQERELGSYWTMLINEIGLQYYMSRAKSKITGNKYHLLTEGEIETLEKLINDRDTYTTKALQKAVYAVEQAEDGSGREFNVLMTIASKHQSHIGNLALENIPDLEVVYMFNPEDMSMNMRSRGNVDVSEIARKHGGGGHLKAAGHPVNVDIRSIINLIYYPEYKEEKSSEDQQERTENPVV